MVMVETFRQKLLAEIPNMPKNKTDVPRWKDKITKRIGCDRSYIDKVLRDYRRDRDPTI